MIRKICYTCITGSYDELRKPAIMTEGWRYICFTDNKELLKHKIHNGYEIIRLENNLDPVRKARYVKIMAPGLKADYLIWHDANMQVSCNLDMFVKVYLRDSDIALPVHPDRNCVYEEARKCRSLNKDSRKVLNEQIIFYRKQGMPRARGLFATGVLVRRAFNKRASVFYKFWWDHIVQFSRRDQISLAYCMWKHKDLIRVNYYTFSDMLLHFPKIKHKMNIYVKR